MKTLHALFVFCGLLILVGGKPVAALDPALLGRVNRSVINWDFRSMSTLPAPITYTRAGTAYEWQSDGLLHAFADNVPMLQAFDPLSNQAIGWGLWGASGAMQNTWGNDFTQATWVKTNVTAALNEVSPDGVTNSASSLLAGDCTLAGGCKVIGSGNTGTAQLRALSCVVKRKTGSGAVRMTADSGTHWNDITQALASAPASTGGWIRVPRQGLYQINGSNAQKLGFQFDTQGDKIAVWGCNFENDLNSGYVPPSPIITTQGIGNLTRAADTATINLSTLPNFNIDSFWFAARVFVPYTWRGFGWAASGARRTILQISPPGDANNLLNLNFQADAINSSATCQYGAGALAGPSCPDVNLDSKIGGVNNTKVRCSTAGAGIATFVPPFGGTFFTVAISYDRVNGVTIVCNNGYGTMAVKEVLGPAQGYAAGLLTQMQLGGPSNFASPLSGYLTALRGGSPALRGAALVAAAQIPSAPSTAQNTLKYNSGACVQLNSGGCYLLGPLGN